MFEANVLYLLRKYLGEYVHGLSAEALKISVWQGDVVLKDLQLKAEALNALKLPVIVKAGFLGSVRLKVPWNRLGKESVEVLLDRIFILAEPIQDEKDSKGNDKEKILEAKQRRLEEAVSAVLEAKAKKAEKPESLREQSSETSSWLGSLIATIIGNLRISITNVHIRYEDSISNLGKPFCMGVTLSRLAAVTTDENSKETFVSSGALDKLHKSLHLEEFAIYHNSSTLPWKVGKKWQDMTPKEWSEVFEAGISRQSCEGSSQSKEMEEFQYLLRPVDGILKYFRHGRKEKRDPAVAFQNVSFVLEEVTLTVSEAQYCDGLKLLEGVSRFRKRIQFSHFRPRVPVVGHSQAWWVYACQAALQEQKKTRSRMSWEGIHHLCSLRRKYVQLYADSLQQKSKTDNQEIRGIEEVVDMEVLLLWRLLAHANKKSKEARSGEETSKKARWWGFGWRTANEDSSSSKNDADKVQQEAGPGGLTKEEWNKINELLSFQPGEDFSLLSSQEDPHMLQTTVDAMVNKSAVRILDKQRKEVLCGNFVTLQVGLHLYPKTLECNVKLAAYGLSAPEGSLIKSVSGRDNVQALTAFYALHPLGSSLDWKFAATILPCYVTVWFGSFERFMQFLKSSHAVSPDVASETAAALQNKIEQVRRRAQEQLKLALEEQSRFSIDLELDAPKVRLPVSMEITKGLDTQLLLDLGHFKLHTANEEETHEHSCLQTVNGGLYSKCYIAGSDIAAYVVDGPFEWSEMRQLISSEGGKETMDPVYKDRRTVYPVLNRCGMLLLVEKLRIPHPTYPSVHIAIQVPHLGLHFSSTRYLRLLQLLDTFNDLSAPKDKAECSGIMNVEPSWYPADHEGSMRVLFWKGLGNAVAEWQPCWGVLSGSYLYILESANSQTYLRCCRINGKQFLEVPSIHIGGSELVVAVCNRGMELQKGLESSSTVIMQFKDEDSKDLWLKVLTMAVYKASAPVSLSLPEDLMDGVEATDTRPADFLGQPVFLMTGSLDTLTTSLYVGKEVEGHTESLILDLEAGGGKVNVLQGQYDLSVGMNLLYLKIHDKLQGPNAFSCKYIARSSVTKLPSERMDTSPKCKTKSGDEDVFNDTVTEFGTSPITLLKTASDVLYERPTGLTKEFVSSLKEKLSNSELEHLIVSRGESAIDKLSLGMDHERKNFVSMSIVSRQFESPDYDGTDIQMIISMATLEFFCNRLTVVTLIDFGSEIGGIIEHQSASFMELESDTGISPETSTDRATVKGLLGHGKSRVVFQLKMNMDTVRMFLNEEDGSQLAMFDQERFQIDIKVYPGSFSVSGTLGNLRLCDMGLGIDHRWGWICDIRDPGSDSLVKLDFQSYNVDEEDYQGYDYSLDGKLSAVRIVFLYKFIEEITMYFSALATPHRQQFTRVVDKVGGIERLVPQSDIDGAPALKLNVSLETPILIMPRCSTSKEFMQLDLGHLKVSNKFEWHGGSKDDASAILLDVLSAEIHGINLIVGIDGVEGKSMIQEVRGLHLKVSRPLRDLFRSVPAVQVDVEVQMLKGIMSDKEYLVIMDCAVANLAETPNLPPDFRNCPSALVESTSSPELIRNSLSEKKSSSRPAGSPWTTVRVTVEVENAELELYNGIERESILARVELHGLWLNYRSSSVQEMDIFLTLPRLCVLDLRSDTKPEMRLMLGSMVDTETFTTPGPQEVYQSGPAPPFLVMDARMKSESQAFVIRIQRPRLLVVIDFLLAVGEFFVPSLAAMNGKEEDMEAYNDPMFGIEHLRLTDSIYNQEEELATFSCDRRLIADTPEIDEYIYDGCGNTLTLDLWGDGASSHDGHPVIVIGPRKKLRFKNISIKNGFRLKDCVQLHSGSSYSVSTEDAVVLDRSGAGSELQETFGDNIDDLSPRTEGATSSKTLVATGVNFILDVQAFAPEFTFYDSDKRSFGGSQRQEKLLRAKMDINLMYACKDTDKWVRAHMKKIIMDAGSGLTVIEPMVISLEYACVKEKTSLTVFTSDISLQLSFSVMRLLLRLYNEVVSTFQFGDDHILAPCSHFDRIWLSHAGNFSRQKLTIWQPRAPPGYAILGHCITSGEAPPSQAVMAMSNKYRRVKRPLGFELVWVLQGSDASTTSQSSSSKDAYACSIWRPIPPPGYAAVGCVAKMGYFQPALTIVHCVRLDLVTTSAASDCIYHAPSQSGVESGFSMWRIENAMGSFVAHHSTESPASVYDLRDIAFERASGMRSNTRDPVYQSTGGGTHSVERKQSISGLENLTSKAGRFIGTTPQFECMWWDKGGDSRLTTAIWRPVPPPGFVIVGDCITEGLEPPNLGVVLRDDNSGRLAHPVRFVQHMHLSGKGQGDLYVLYPMAPPGYVTLGYVVSKTEDESSLGLVRCVRANLVNEANVSKKAAWSASGFKSGYNCSLWKVENQANTFLARPDLKRPASRLGYGLVESVQNKLKDNLSAEIKIPRFSVTVFDDFGGLMTPLVDLTVTSINLAANGRREALNGVCIASMAASTFNAQRESWEPLIEPFEGIFKYESHGLQSGLAFKTGKRVRITTVNTFNLNVTSANVNALTDAYLAWRKQSELEQESSIKELENDGNRESLTSEISSALEEDDSQKLVIENTLGYDMYLRTVEDNVKDCRVLKSGTSMKTYMPPPNFQDKITRPRLKIPLQQVSVYISEARGLAVNDDGNGHEYFYSLRVSSGKQHPDAQKIPVQSARSRCVKPSALVKEKGITVATVNWNEVFVFDLPYEGFVNMDVRVTNQAAKAGKGELVGMLSIPLKEEGDQSPTAPSSHWKFIQQSASQPQQSHFPQLQKKMYNLEFPRRQVPIKSGEKHPQSGSIVASIYSFTEQAKRHAEEERDKYERDIGLLIGTSRDGPWSSIPSILTLGPLPIEISGSQLALVVATNGGQKHVILRSLVVVSNKTDVALEFCVCPLSLLNIGDDVSPHMLSEPVIETEEMFENQRYQPLAGWGSRWPGHFLPTDPGRWSRRDYQNSSQSLDDVQPSLPPGWIWSSEWIIDKAGYVDDDGWAYGPDFQSLRWPPNSLKSYKKSPFDFIRRRRWIRSRRRISELNRDHCRKIIAVVHPDCSVPIPSLYVSAKSDYCIQVRPQADGRYLWGKPVRSASLSTRGSAKFDGQPSGKSSLGVNKEGVSASLFMLNQLQRTEELLMCSPSQPSVTKIGWWLSMEADANLLCTKIDSSVYDWKITVSSPLKLENMLPCAAEYMLWERQGDSSPVKRDRGLAVAAGTIHVYSVDIRRQIYMTWLVQGGWKLEKEIVLISDPVVEELPSTFSLLNQHSGRKLQISLERDFGGTTLSPRIVRIFVPYWLCNKASLPLSYSMVEVEPTKESDMDTPWLMRAVKAAKYASSRPSHSPQKKNSRLQRVVQKLDAIENTGVTPTMLSPQAYYNRTAHTSFSPRADDSLLSPRVGISLAVSQASFFKEGFSFRVLEENERIIVKAMDSTGGYYKLSVFLSTSSERTKVVNIQPHALFVNRLGRALYLRQGDLEGAELLYSNDPPKVFFWQAASEPEVIKVSVDGCNWSSSFSVESEGTLHIISRDGQESKIIRAEIRNGTTESRFLIIFRPVSFASPYRIENHSLVLPIQFRQCGAEGESWQVLQPGCATAFAWEDLQREHQLEIIVEGTEPSKARKYRIDECIDYQPIDTEGTPVAALHVQCCRQGSTQVVKVCDWMPSNRGSPINLATSSKTSNQEQHQLHETNQSFQTPGMEEHVYISLELAELGISLVDQTPEELAYLSMQNFTLSFATGLGSGISRFKVRVDGLQLDNQLPLTPMPVLFRPQLPESTLDSILKCTITSQSGGSSGQYVYPYIGIQGPIADNAAFLINIHEPILWRLHEMLQHLNLSRMTSSQTTDVAIDPIIYIGLLNTSEIRFKVSLVMTPTQRPRDAALGFWASLMTALGNTDDMQVRIAPHVHEDICMRRSSLFLACMSGLKKDLLSHPLLLLSGVDILGNASSALGHMSKGVAALSMDKKFMERKKKQDTKAAVEGFGDGVREGAEALGKGFFRGVTGILTKPLEGARASGVEGFMQGVGKGIIGAAAQPVSGVLDLLSKTTEGANAVKMKIAAVITSEAILLRRRLPRVIGADSILRPFDDYKAQGQVLLQLAQGGSLFGPIDIFKVRGKYAMTDVYEDHYNLPKGRTLIITHRRVILLQHPTSMIVQKKLDPQKDPCSVLWDVTWKDLGTIELIPGKYDTHADLASRLALHLRRESQDANIFDPKQLVRIIKCEPNSDQATKIFAAIQQGMDTYGHDGSRALKERAKRVTAPYSGPILDSASVGLPENAAPAVNMPPMSSFSAITYSTG